MSAAENVLSMRKISNGANKIKNIREVPCFIIKGGPCMKQVPVRRTESLQDRF